MNSKTDKYQNDVTNYIVACRKLQIIIQMLLINKKGASDKKNKSLSYLVCLLVQNGIKLVELKINKHL